MNSKCFCPEYFWWKPFSRLLNAYFVSRTAALTSRESEKHLPRATSVNDRHERERRPRAELNNLCTWVYFRRHWQAMTRLSLSRSAELLLFSRIEMTRKLLFLFCLFLATSALNYLWREISTDTSHTSAFFQMIKMRVQVEIRFSRSFHHRQRSWLSLVTLPSTNLRKKMSGANMLHLSLTTVDSLSFTNDTLQFSTNLKSWIRSSNGFWKFLIL